METSQPLAIESFSYSWLKNSNSPFDGLDEPFRASVDSFDEAISKEICEMKSKRLFPEAQNFNFDVPVSESPAALVHADELFSDGLIKPVFVNPSKKEALCTSNSIPGNPVSSLSSRTVLPIVRFHCHFPRKWQKWLQRIFPKHSGFFKLWCQKGGCPRKSTRVDDIDRRVQQVKSWNNPPQQSQRLHASYSSADLCDVESSIYEAVLHCKRSIEK